MNATSGSDGVPPADRSNDEDDQMSEATERRLQRAQAELRAGGAVLLRDDQADVLALSPERASPDRLAALAILTGAPADLLISRRRAALAGLVAPIEADDPRGVEPVAAPIRDIADPAWRLAADPTRSDDGTAARERALGRLRPAGRASAAAIALAKRAGLLPALVSVELPAGRLPGGASALDPVIIDAKLLKEGQIAAGRLKRVAEARVPLADAENCRIIAFRPSDGGPEHLAIVVGEPTADAPILARLHSECFTGDLLGSLRCDCGEQLKGAIRTMAAAGGGVVLYMAQEGRGIGLINKLRAYDLQDRGLDTVDANLALGYEADERDFRPAAEMLRALGHQRIRLLTNNPAKVQALGAHGIEVVERVPHAFPANGHNAGYLSTKARRAGHML